MSDVMASKFLASHSMYLSCITLSYSLSLLGCLVKFAAYGSLLL